MLSFEKIRISTNSFFNSFLYHLVFWNIALFLFVYLTNKQTFIIKFLDFGIVDTYYSDIIFTSGIITGLFVFWELLFSERIIRFFPQGTMLLLKPLFYFFVALFIIFFSHNKNVNLDRIFKLEYLIKNVPPFGPKQYQFLLYFFLSSIINNVFREMFKKIGFSNFFDWILGGLSKPKEVQKIFMFIDMKDSTSIAEKLGNKKFSRLVQDVFNDMSILYNYQASIYNYLGDGAVVVWDVNVGTHNNNCLKAFFAFLKVIQRKSKYYGRKYGLVPAFKAGLHLGDVMVLQVGTIRRDISYNGDTINTAARVEGQCNNYDHDLLISGDLCEELFDDGKFIFKEVGVIKLKGKSKGVNVIKVIKNIKKK